MEIYGLFRISYKNCKGLAELKTLRIYNEIIREIEKWTSYFLTLIDCRFVKLTKKSDIYRANGCFRGHPCLGCYLSVLM